VILYESTDLLAVAKPAGIAVIPGRGEAPSDSLRGQLEATRAEKLWIVHRIDRDTSGVVLFARTAEAHRTLSMAFEAREVEKTYLAWILGAPTQLAGSIETPLHTARKGRMRPALPGEADSLHSRSDYRVAATRHTALGPVARVEVRPMTGRQHQIRVHLRSVEAPLLVDPIYAKRDRIESGALGPESPPMARLTLHAASLTIQWQGQPRTIDAPLPADLAALDTWLAAGLLVR